MDQLQLNVDAKQFVKEMADSKDQLALAVTSSMRSTATLAKNGLRKQVTRAKLGDRLAKTWQAKTYPRAGKNSLEAATYIYSNASEIIDAFDKGIRIKAQGGRWLAIPTEHAVSGDGKRKAKPQDYKGNLTFIPPKSRNENTVLIDPEKEQVVFILVRSIRIKKLLDVDKIASKYHKELPDRIAKNWKKLEDGLF
jgi:hypothetical protein